MRTFISKMKMNAIKPIPYGRKNRHSDIYKLAILFSQIVLLIEFFSLFLNWSLEGLWSTPY